MAVRHRYIIVGLVFISFALSGYLIFRKDQPYTVAEILKELAIEKPASMVKFKDHYVATELINNRLAISSDDSFSKVSFFNPRNIGKSFQSPHFLAVSPQETLLISNGWGNSIIEIEDLKGGGWKMFNGKVGKGKKFNAPHGLCVSDNGWIYVGDSLNSRIVRFRDMSGTDFEVFSDNDKLVSYSRQLVCEGDSLWVSNSYENREGLNKGNGANVLRIDDFSSGKAEVVFALEGVTFSGIAPLGKRLMVAVWAGKKSVIDVDLASGRYEPVEQSSNELGVPYGLFTEKGRIFVTYFGDFEKNNGGIAILDN